VDHPLLNLLFGLGLIFTLVINIGLRVLLSKVRLPLWMSGLSWVALILSLLSALYIENLFLRFMTPGFNRQIALGLLVIGVVGVLVTAGLYPRAGSERLASIMFGAQILVCLCSLAISFLLYRSLVPISIG
jgi:hypothetical protein